jgi:hypothetical protein
MGRIFTGNRYATVTSTVALVIALSGGTAYAAELITSKGIKDGGVKRVDIASGAVNSAKVADGSLLKGDFKAGQLPAGPAGPAGATGATGAPGVKGDKGDPGDPTAPGKSGDVYSGALGETAPSGEFLIASASWPRVLPSGTPTITRVITTSTTAECPGVGQAAAGILCIYVYNSSNMTNTGSLSGGSNDADTRRYGFAIDLFIAVDANPAYILATWAYQVP